MDPDHFRQIMEQLHEIRKENRKIMTQIDDLNAAVTNIGTDVSTIATELTSVQTDVATVIADLQAALANGTAPDLSGAIAALQTAHATLGQQATALSGVDASIKAVINPPAVPTSTTDPAPTTGDTSAEGSSTSAS